MTGAGIACSGAFLQWIHCPMEVFAPARHYLRICMLGIVPQFIYNMGNAVLRSLGNTKSPLYFLTFSSALNLLLDLLFIIGLGMGLPGAGMATVIAQWVLAVLMIWKMTCLDEQYQLRISGLCGGTAETGGDRIHGASVRNAGDLYEHFFASDSSTASIPSGQTRRQGWLSFPEWRGFCTIRLFPMVWHLPDLSVRTTVHTAWIA